MQQQFSLSYLVTIPGGTVTIDLASSADETFALTSATRRCLRNGDTAADVWEYLETALNAGSALTWGISDVSGSYQGRAKLVAFGSEAVTDLTLPTGLGVILGFTSDVLTPVVTTVGPTTFSTFSAPHRSKGIYIPEPPEEVYYDPDDWEDIATVLQSQSPTGGFTVDDYGTVRQRRVTVSSIRGYSARACYVDADYGQAQGVAVADPNCSWEEWVAGWRASGAAASLILDASSPGTPTQVWPKTSESWFARPSTALERVSSNPLRYDLVFTVLEEV